MIIKWKQKITNKNHPKLRNNHQSSEISQTHIESIEQRSQMTKTQKKKKLQPLTDTKDHKKKTATNSTTHEKTTCMHQKTKHKKSSQIQEIIHPRGFTIQPQEQKLIKIFSGQIPETQKNASSLKKGGMRSHTQE